MFDPRLKIDNSPQNLKEANEELKKRESYLWKGGRFFYAPVLIIISLAVLLIGYPDPKAVFLSLFFFLLSLFFFLKILRAKVSNRWDVTDTRERISFLKGFLKGKEKDK